ncbi:MAG: MinD/ParA family protein [Burkholderiales bacterium]
MLSLSSRPMPLDQAYGLRQLFARPQLLCIPLVSNPHVPFGGVILERLCAAFTMLGKKTLVIDAAEHSPDPHEIADIDLGASVEALSSDVFYLAARGLPLRWVNASGSTAPFLEAAAQAVPQAEVALVHANALEMCRLFGHSTARSLLMADDHPISVTHSYAAMKMLTQRAGLKIFDVLLCIESRSPRAGRIASQLARCADDFFGGIVRECIQIDPAYAAQDMPTPELLRWAYLALHALETDKGISSAGGTMRLNAAESHCDGFSALPCPAMN